MSVECICSEIIRVISKSDERVVRVLLEITSLIWDQNCMTRSSITTLLQPYSVRTNILLTEQPVRWKAEAKKLFTSFTSLRNQKRITSHFVFETEMVRYRVKMVRFINRNDAIWNMNDAIYERCDLEEKIVWIVNKTHCWDPIRFQGSPVISKWI